MGFEPNQPPSRLESVNEFKDRMAKGLEEARAAMAKAQSDYKLYYDRRREPAPDLKPGDKVWLDASDIQTTSPSAKLSHRRLGPFEVESRVGPGAYKLKLPFSMRQLHPVFPIVKLTPAPPDPFPGRQVAPPPPPDIIDGHEEFEVETILDSRLRYRKVQYLVKWKGYGIGENSWEPAANLHAPDAVADFYRRNPGAPRQINRLNFDRIRFSPADLSPSWRSRHVGSTRP